MIRKIKNILKSFLDVKDLVKNRDNWVIERIKSFDAKLKILDAGCGDQKYKIFCQHLDYYTQDFGEYKPSSSNNKSIQYDDWEYGKLDYVGNIWNIDEVDEFFDIIICTEVLEHIPYPEKTLEELIRLLKPNGVLLLTAPFSSVPHMAPYYFCTGFSEDFYKYFAKKYNMEIIEISPNGNSYDVLAIESHRSSLFIRNKITRVIYKLFIYLVFIPIMKILSKKDTTTSRILNVGYHVSMIKKAKI